MRLAAAGCVEGCTGLWPAACSAMGLDGAAGGGVWGGCTGCAACGLAALLLSTPTRAAAGAAGHAMMPGALQGVVHRKLM